MLAISHGWVTVIHSMIKDLEPVKYSLVCLSRHMFDYGICLQFTALIFFISCNVGIFRKFRVLVGINSCTKWTALCFLFVCLPSPRSASWWLGTSHYTRWRNLLHQPQEQNYILARPTTRATLWWVGFRLFLFVDWRKKIPHTSVSSQTLHNTFLHLEEKANKPQNKRKSKLREIIVSVMSKGSPKGFLQAKSHFIRSTPTFCFHADGSWFPNLLWGCWLRVKGYRLISNQRGSLWFKLKPHNMILSFSLKLKCLIRIQSFCFLSFMVTQFHFRIQMLCWFHK